MKKTTTIIILSLIIAGGIVAWKSYNRSGSQPVGPAVCTQEAKLCPDGSYVGRTGPNCEFEACPTPQAQTNPGWLTFNDPTQGISFQYPETLGTKYIFTNQWPPKVTVNYRPFSCTIPEASIPENMTSLKTINGRSYCVNVNMEGTAGSEYTTYGYSTEINGKFVRFDFVLQYPQCSNYPEPQKTECDTEERANLNLNDLIDQIAQSVKMN